MNMRTHRHAGWATRRSGWALVALGLALTVGPALALAPGSMVTWSSGTPEGWKLADAISYQGYTLPVSGNAATIPFNSFLTSTPKPQEYMVKGDVQASAGAFTGDYWNGGVASITFRLLVESHSPRAIHVVLHSANGEQEWRREVPVPAVGQWVDVEVPLQFGAGWYYGRSGTAELYQNALQNIDWIGVAVQRSGSVLPAHNVKVDDLQITGAPATVTLSGIVTYRGEQGGTVRALAAESKYSWSLERSAIVGASGAYAIGQVPSLQDYWVKAFVDSNGNGTHDFWEAFGWYNNETRLSRVLGDLAGLNIVLSDPATAEGLPYWWLREYFGITAPEGSGGEALPGAELDSDGDTMSNWAEYKAGTDPTDFASRFTVGSTPDANGLRVVWNAKPGALYDIWRSSAVATGYEKVESGVAGGEYVDVEATGDGPYFYRVEVQ